MTHPNEIRITESNRDKIMAEAQALGEAYVAALQEQMQRQTGK